MCLEERLETAAVCGVQRIHLSGSRVLAALYPKRLADDRCDGTRVRQWSNATNQWNSESDASLQSDLEAPQATAKQRELKKIAKVLVKRENIKS